MAIIRNLESAFKQIGREYAKIQGVGLVDPAVVAEKNKLEAERAKQRVENQARSLANIMRQGGKHESHQR